MSAKIYPGVLQIFLLSFAAIISHNSVIFTITCCREKLHLTLRDQSALTANSMHNLSVYSAIHRSPHISELLYNGP